jgi:hypothetical protein
VRRGHVKIAVYNEFVFKEIAVKDIQQVSQSAAVFDLFGPQPLILGTLLL